MIVIGTDTHKRSHALAAVDAATGAVVGQHSISADAAGHLRALRWACALDDDRVWALEDCRHVSGRLERALVLAGERVTRVPPRLMGQSRRGERQVGKSDQIDALALARAVLREGVERFPAAFLDERAMEIRLLADHRTDLVASAPESRIACAGTCSIFAPTWRPSCRCALLHSLARSTVTRKLRELPANNPRARIARQLVSAIRQLTRHADAIETELRGLVRAHSPQLLAQTGCGVLTAATLIGRTAGAERFATASFAHQAGTAPIPASSGNRTRHRLHRGGDRALHTIAITRAAHDAETRAYIQRKLAEGKTRREAVRCLKRHLARRFYRHLSQPQTTAPAISTNTLYHVPYLT